MSPTGRSRRELLAGLAVAAAGGMAGCGGVFAADDDTPTPEPYDHLRDERVFVAETLALSVPDPIEAVDDPANADVVVLPATTDRSAETGVGWIESGKRIALVGTESEATWLAWQDSDAYAAAYPDHRGRARSCSGDSSGGGAGTPTECLPPDLVVAWQPDADVPTTHRKTWAGTDDPTDEQVFGAVDDSFEEW